VSSYTIGEAAERSGFTPSALRYYEGIGLVGPSTRSDAGYRIYDDATSGVSPSSPERSSSDAPRRDRRPRRDLGRRAVRPVQRQFHELVTTKLVETERQIDELTALQRSCVRRPLACPVLRSTVPATNDACFT
jgi:hypothetical protein